MVEPAAQDPEHPQHPQHPEHPEHPQHPQHPEHPQHPQHPEHPEHPQHPQHPQHPEQHPQSPPEELHWLHDVWSFYFHDPEDASWTLESYKRLGDAATVEDAWEIHSAVSPHASAGMFFLMREHVFPCWDDKHNIGGGCLSIKVPIDAARAAWDLLVKRAIGETMVVDDAAWSKLNGISISPKRGFCIAKLWLADETLTSRAAFRLPEDYRGEVVYRSNRENMQSFAAQRV